MANNNSESAVVESAVALKDQEKKELTQLAYKIAGSELPVQFKVSDKLLGGFTIQVGDRKFDASLKTELDQLTESLKGQSNG